MEGILACAKEHAPALVNRVDATSTTTIASPPKSSDTPSPDKGTVQPANDQESQTPTLKLPVAGQLKIVQFPPPALIPPDNSGCQMFESKACAELRWESISGLRSGEVTRIRIAPSNPDVIYAVFDANDMSAWKSTNAGRSWKRVHHFAHASDLIVHPTDPDFALYSTLENNVYGTKDGGQSWKPVLTAAAGFERGASQFNALAQHVSQPNVIYAATGGEQQKSRTAGGTSVIYRSSNLGDQWEETWAGSDLGAVYALAVAIDDPDQVIAGSNTGIFRSTDAGESWVSVWSDQGIRNGKIYRLVNTRADPDLLFAAHTEAGLLRSDDGGSTWVLLADGIGDTRIHEVVIAPSNPHIVYVGTHSGVFRSTDRGLTWQSRNDGLEFANITALDVHPNNPDVAYTGTGVQNTTNHREHFTSGFQSGDGLYKTDNGGLSWVRTDANVEEHGIVSVTGDPNHPFRFWLGGRAARGAFMSPDGGNTFLYNPSLASHYAMIIASGRQPPYPLYMTSWQRGGELMKSENLGESWTSLTSQLVSGINAESRAAGLYTDARSPVLHLHGLAIDPNNDNILYVGSVHDNVNPVDFSLTGVHIFKSTDGGESFIETSQGIPTTTETAVGFIVVDPTDSNLVYAAFTQHESVNSIGVYKSTNAGTSWAPANVGLSDSANLASAQRRLLTAIRGGGSLNVRHLVVDPVNRGTIYAATSGGVFKSTNAAGRWQSANTGITTTEIYTLAMSPTNPNILYAATADGVFKTKNGASTWYEVNLGLPIGQQSFTMGHHIVLSFDRTGSILFAVIQAGTKEWDAQRLVYRAVMEPLASVEYTYDLNVAEETVNVSFESTSSIYDVSFAQEDNTLSFIVAGPSGTTGRTTMLVPRSFLVAPFQVTLDGSPIQFESSSSQGVSSSISISYPHATQEVTVTGRIPRLATSKAD
ncbi:hypothetical protein M1O29_01165 [Dehalococcoidia bacterium]|nr:hypothetical protein [Dehalococcoidia bacterium]